MYSLDIKVYFIEIKDKLSYSKHVLGSSFYPKNCTRLGH